MDLWSFLFAFGKAILGTFLVICMLAVAGVGMAANTAASFIGLLFEYWIIQAVFAAWLGFALEQSAAASARTKDLLNSTYDRKLQTAKSLTLLVDKRLYASRRYLSVLVNEPGIIAEERKRYQSVVAEWNEVIKSHQVSLLMDFDDAAYGLDIDLLYMPKFAEVDRRLRFQRELREAQKEPLTSETREIQKLLWTINRESIDMMREMLRQAQIDRRVLDSEVPLREENLHHISIWRLIKSLLKLGKEREAIL